MLLIGSNNQQMPDRNVTRDKRNRPNQKIEESKAKK